MTMNFVFYKGDDLETITYGIEASNPVAIPPGATTVTVYLAIEGQREYDLFRGPGAGRLQYIDREKCPVTKIAHEYELGVCECGASEDD